MWWTALPTPLLRGTAAILVSMEQSTGSFQSHRLSIIVYIVHLDKVVLGAVAPRRRKLGRGGEGGGGKRARQCTCIRRGKRARWIRRGAGWSADLAGRAKFDVARPPTAPTTSPPTGEHSEPAMSGPPHPLEFCVQMGKDHVTPTASAPDITCQLAQDELCKSKFLWISAPTVACALVATLDYAQPAGVAKHMTQELQESLEIEYLT